MADSTVCPVPYANPVHPDYSPAGLRADRDRIIAGGVDTSSFNHHDTERMQNPYPFYSAVRQQCPVAHSDQLGGFYFAVTHEAAKQVLSDYRNFTSTEGVALPSMNASLYPVDLDPPRQTRYRKVLNQFFSVAGAQRRRDAWQAIIDRMIDGFIEHGAADVANQLTKPAISAIMLPIIGIPMQDRVEFTAAIDFLSNARTTDAEAMQRANAYIGSYLMQLSASRRQDPNVESDYLHMLIEQPIDGKHLDDADICKVLLVTLFGALDTTHATLSEAILHLSRNPADKDALRSGAVAWPNAIEEFVRFASPIQALRRTATHDFDYAGTGLRKGDPVLAFIGAGNRDPVTFPDPDSCILSRPTVEHLGFGSGGHVCLGRNFARVIIEIVLTSLLERMPDFTVPADFVPSYTSGEGRRMKSLPIRFSPGQRIAI